MTAFDLSDRFEHAVIALAIKKANSRKDRKRGYLGRTALQKIIYFLVRRQVPVSYQFEIYHYGPFCSDLYHDIDCLLADGVVEDKSTESKYSNYVPGLNIDALLAEFEDELSPWEDEIQSVTDIFADLRPETLELVATLDYLYQDEAAKSGGVPAKDSVVNRFIAVKGQKFERTTVERMFDTLGKVRLFE